jgi:hypothetical protein
MELDILLPRLQEIDSVLQSEPLKSCPHNHIIYFLNLIYA